MSSELGIILQARTGSTRLPNKMVLPFYNEKGVLELLLERLKSKFAKYKIVVATTMNTKDDQICDIAKRLGVDIFRGDEADVLQRFINAAEYFSISKVIRICADNPFLDMQALSVLIEKFKDNNSDYLFYSKKDKTPTIKTHYGFWAEAVTLDALKKVAQMTNETLYHEHVTNYIYSTQNLFSISNINIPIQIEENNNIRLTLDTIDDFEMQKTIFKEVMKIYNEISIDRVLNYLENNTRYYSIMKNEIIKNSK